MTELSQNPISQYSRSNVDKLYADSKESLFGHLVVERGRSVKTALEELRPHVKQALKSTETAVSWCQKLGIGGVGVGVLVGASMGIGYAALPILAGCLSLKFWADSREELPRREAEYHLLKECANLPEALYALHLRGVNTSVLVGSYDALINSVEARLERNAEFTEAEVGQFLDAKIKALGTIAPVTTQLQQGIQPIGDTQNNEGMTRAKDETPGITGIQPIAIDQEQPIAAPSSTTVKPGDSIGLDLASELIAMPEFCHVLLAGENGTGKTTFALALLKPIINKFIPIPGFELLLIDPKRSRWNGLFQTKSYQSAFSNQPGDLEKSVNRLELIYFKLDKLSSARQKTGKRTEVPTLVIIDEVNTWLDALKAFDRTFKEENSTLPPADRLPLPRLYNRAVDSIAGISRMGREDRVWLWLIGQNSNLEALGLSGAQDRANFSIVAVGLGDNQITIELALGNSAMFTRGQALRNALKEHQGKPYQIAACTRKPANLLIMPSSYKGNAQEDFSPEILTKLGAPSTTIAAVEVAKLEALYRSPSVPDIDHQTTVMGIGSKNWEFIRPDHAVPVEATAIEDPRPDGLDSYPIAEIVWNYLNRKGAKKLKDITNAMRNSKHIELSDLEERMNFVENYQDGINQLLTFSVNKRFIKSNPDGTFEAIKKL